MDIDENTEMKMKNKKGGKVCSVLNCTNTAYKSNGRWSFHLFPKAEERMKVWANFCRRGDDWKPRYCSTICSAHFQTSDYELGYLMGCRPMKRLRPDAFPTIYGKSLQETERHTCSVASCKSDSLSGGSLSFHSFPERPERNKVWAKFCCRGDKWKPDEDSRICSAHFEADDYELENSTGYKRTNVLKEDAFPSMYVDSINSSWQPKVNLRISSAPNDDINPKSLVDTLLSNDTNEMLSTEYSDETLLNNDHELNSIKKKPRKGGHCCAVSGCKNTKLGNTNMSFHVFPKDPDRRKEWIKFCRKGSSDWKPAKDERICSAHFRTDHFELASLMGYTKKALLKENVCPTIYDDIDPEYINCDLSNESHASGFKTIPLNDYFKLIEENKRLLALSKVQAQTIEKLTTFNNNLKKNAEQHLSFETCKTLKAKINSLKNDLEVMTKNTIKKSDLHKELKNRALSHALTKNQIDILLKRKNQTTWTKAEISSAFTLRYFSMHAYRFIKQKFLPLPGAITLGRYAQKINLYGGILPDVLYLMKIAAKTLKPKDRIVVLMYDEMSVRPLVEYDQDTDQVIGPHSSVQIVLVRGLFADWKQPIFVGFDIRLTADLLSRIIVELHKISYSVVALVSDCKPSKREILTELNVSASKTYFDHPVTKNKICCFLDTPQLLNMTRNALLDQGFVVEDGTVISKDPLRKLNNVGPLILEDNTVFMPSIEDLTCAQAERDNLELANQLMSHAIALSLHKYGTDKESAHLAYFIETISNWFDVMNSHNLYVSNDSNQPFKSTAKQNTILDNVSNLIASVRCVGEQYLQTFQEGIMISTASLKTLCFETNEQPILTYKLNQNALETLFSHIKTDGESEENFPTPLNVINAMRLIIFGKSLEYIQTGEENIIVPSKEQYLAGEIFKTAFVKPAVREKLPNDILSNWTDPTEIVQEIESNRLDSLNFWLANKFSKRYRQIFDYSCKLDTRPTNVLIQPSEKLKNDVILMNHRFNEINPHRTFKFKRGIIKRLTNRVGTKVKQPRSIIREWFLQRTLIRVKHINLELLKKPRILV